MRCMRVKTMYTPSQKLEDAWIAWDEKTGVISQIGTGPFPPDWTGQPSDNSFGNPSRNSFGSSINVSTAAPVGEPPHESLNRELGELVFEPAAEGGILCPGFIDIHVHGGGGHDPCAVALDLLEHSKPSARCTVDERVGCVKESLLELARYEASTGVTGFLPTTGALPDEVNQDIIRSVFELISLYLEGERGKSGAEFFSKHPGSRILGVNLEGPFISPKKKGAQPLKYIQSPSVGKARDLVEFLPHVVKMMTLAPEVPGVLEVIEYLLEKRVVASLGHSDSSYDEAQRGIDAGISHATHVFSGMRGFHHREPGALGAVLLENRVTAELIMDGIHAHPLAARMLLKLKGVERVALITDAISAAGLDDGEYSLYGAKVRVQNGAATLEDGLGGRVLAGSTLNMARAVKNMVEMVGTSVQEALTMACENPARIIGVFEKVGSLSPGKDASFVILNNDFSVQRTFVNGVEVYRRS